MQEPQTVTSRLSSSRSELPGLSEAGLREAASTLWTAITCLVERTLLSKICDCRDDQPRGGVNREQVSVDDQMIQPEIGPVFAVETLDVVCRGAVMRQDLLLGRKIVKLHQVS